MKASLLALAILYNWKQLHLKKTATPYVSVPKVKDKVKKQNTVKGLNPGVISKVG